MNKIIFSLKQVPDWQIKFQVSNRLNHIGFNPLSRLQEQNLLNLNKHLEKLSIQTQEKYRISWVSSEYQALEILINSLSVIHSKKIQDFNSAQWNQLLQIFSYKVPLTIKYQAKRIIIQKRQPRRRWEAQQENFLIEIVKNEEKKNKWNDIARELFIRSNGKYFRQGKHCRERWLNHLHPLIQNNKWTLEEDINLLAFILKKGKKWTNMVKIFSMKRSQCMIKKRFYELTRLQDSEQSLSQSLRNNIKQTLETLKANLEKINSVNESLSYFQQKVYHSIANEKNQSNNSKGIHSFGEKNLEMANIMAEKQIIPIFCESRDFKNNNLEQKLYNSEIFFLNQYSWNQGSAPIFFNFEENLTIPPAFSIPHMIFPAQNNQFNNNIQYGQGFQYY